MTSEECAAAPDPLVPTEVDLTDFAFMPLEVRRLRDSRIGSAITGEEFRCAIMLWCASWHQIPAASLPDDDLELAKLAGFGRALRDWRKQKPGALYGWVRCTDGRLYHPVVAEKALESWRSKLEVRYTRECERLRKENKRREENREPRLSTPSFDEWNTARLSAGKAPFSAGKEAVSAGKPDLSAGTENLSGGTPPTFRRTSAGIPAENALKGDLRDREGIHTRAPARARVHAREASGGMAPKQWAEILGAYPKRHGRRNEIAGEKAAGRILERGEANAEELLQGVERYAAYCAHPEISGWYHPLAIEKFFSEADRPWRQPWAPPLKGAANGAELDPEAMQVWKQLVDSNGAQPDRPRPAAVEAALEAVGGFMRIRMCTITEAPKLKLTFSRAFRQAHN